MSLILPAHVHAMRAAAKLKDHIQSWANDVIWKEYPGHLFSVEFNLFDRSYQINHPLMADNKASMFIPGTCENVEAELKRLAGEVLERANLPRKALESYQQYDDAKATAKEAFKCR